MKYILSLISPEAILNLPWQIHVPTFAIIALLLLRSVFSVLKFSPIKAISSIVYAILIAIIISNAGHMLVQFIPDQSTQKSTVQTNN
ncbi:MAG: hypothetical protein COC17_04605 [Hyphomicrobiales bacterium]|nr:hypothetical protein [Hyphomicrobiales bacterium]PCH50599.1 MAG: hypothetical protein COC17_04605 [Hyphomicrobiales bacterium]